MLEKIPSESIMTDLLGKQLYDVWLSLSAAIDERYGMERSWNNGGKKWIYEYKYRKGGKTLCSLYARENCLGFMIIFGKDECLKFEESRESFSAEIQEIYDESKIYHDGKWVMFYPCDESMFSDFMRLLAIKRKSNKTNDNLQASKSL